MNTHAHTATFPRVLFCQVNVGVVVVSSLDYFAASHLPHELEEMLASTLHISPHVIVTDAATPQGRKYLSYWKSLKHAMQRATQRISVTADVSELNGAILTSVKRSAHTKQHRHRNTDRQRHTDRHTYPDTKKQRQTQTQTHAHAHSKGVTHATVPQLIPTMSPSLSPPLSLLSPSSLPPLSLLSPSLFLLHHHPPPPPTVYHSGVRPLSTSVCSYILALFLPHISPQWRSVTRVACHIDRTPKPGEQTVREVERE